MLPDLCYQTAGWDIGGAHVKLAFVHEQQMVVRQWHCPLWQGVQELNAVFESASHVLPESISRHHVTMTGELVDIFASHDDGVEQIMRAFIQQVAPIDNVRFFSSQGLLTFAQALENKSSVASANWIASAESIEKHIEHGIFVDVGSTTTDILSIHNHQLVRHGVSDFDRLQSGELVYTGVVRSCVNTLTNEIPYKNRMVPLMAENFSTSADVYRILEWLPSHADYGSTMDGKEKNKIASMARLARMIGKDYCADDEAEWEAACDYIAGQQMLMIESSIVAGLRKHPEIKHIVGAGVGRFLVKKMAERLFLKYVDFSACVVPAGISYQNSDADCAPAVALVFLSAGAE